MAHSKSGAGGGYRWVSVTLFLCLFAAQAALIAMVPVLTQAAGDLHVSTAAAGQLRTIAGAAAAVTSVALGTLAGRVGLRRQLLAACMLAGVGSIASSLASNYVMLAVAQLPIGVAVAVLTTAGTLAAAEWVAPELQTRALSWALAGQPAAWIVGMPLVGVVGERSWRYGWLALPLVAAVAAGGLVALRGRHSRVQSRPARVRVALRDRAIARWLTSELCANAAWAATLVYAGALFTESYGTSTPLTGSLLALAAAAHVAGNLVSRRLVRRDSRRVLVRLAVLLAVFAGLFGMARVNVAVSTGFFAAAAVIAGGRTLVASSHALAAAPEIRAGVTALRAATMQLGYVVGSSAGGAALAVGGYGGLGATVAALLLAAAGTLARPRQRRLFRPNHRRDPIPASGYDVGSDDLVAASSTC